MFVVKLYSRKIFAYVFFVQKYFHNEIKANYGMVLGCCTEARVTHTRTHIPGSVSNDCVLLAVVSHWTQTLHWGSVARQRVMLQRSRNK